ncbi:MAG TPA: ADOP family duplicated permease [Gemmatimonadales bacterium]|jgi:putative ABC transport system permease protein|nr:ADOP family duplicated permease [Gemmatimonadales bacterium]
MRVRLDLEKLQSLLARSRLSQNHWALKVGLSRGHWSDIVNGKHPYPSPKTRQRMLEVLGVPFETLFAIEVEPGAGPGADFAAALKTRYLIDRELGQGAMGSVYLARDLARGRVVAVKVLAPEAVCEIGADALVREIGAVSQLQHPHILPLFDSGVAAEHPFFVMPWIRGGSLKDRLGRETRMALPAVLRLVRGIAAALQHGHAERIIHCDVKPGNVLLQEEHPYLTDFGISRRIHDGGAGWRARRGLDISAGTPAYVSPEQANGDEDLDGRADIYSLACVVYEMLTGRPPFDGATTEIVVAQRFLGPPPRLRDYAPEVPDGVADAIARAMEVDRSRRPDKPIEFVDALEAGARGAGTAVMRVSLAATRGVGALRRWVGQPATNRMGGMVMSLFSEFRSAVRALVRTPTVAVAAVLCLTLGIGATAAVWSAISRALLRPLPFRDQDRLVAVHRTTPQSGPQGTWPQSAPNYIDLAHASTQIERLSALSWGTALVGIPGDAVQAPELYASGQLFPMLGVTPQIGRVLGPDDDRAGAPAVAMISDELWRTHFGGDPTIINRSILIDGTPTTIVGVLPAEFQIPHGANFFNADVWEPIRFTAMQLTRRRSNYLSVLGRLAPGATVASADAEMRGLFRNLRATYPYLQGDDIRVAPLRSESLSFVKTPLLLLLGAVGMVLLIAVTNVAALLLARGVQRRRETAIRTAIGASRWETMRPALLEALVITGVGLVGGIGLAALGVKTIGALAAARLPQLAGLRVDLRVLGFSLALSLAVAVACGLWPAWRGAQVDPQDALRAGRGSGGGREHHRALRGLVVFEMCLSLVLLLGAGLVLKGFVGLLGKDPGFDPARILSLTLTTSAQRYPNTNPLRGMLEPAFSAIRSVPGVEETAAINIVPYVNWGNNSNVRYEGQPSGDPERLPLVEERDVTPGFFAVTGQRLLAGRLLSPADDDRPQAAPVVVVNQALVKRDFKNGDAVGKRFYRSDTTFATIVGVVSDIRNFGPVSDPQPEMYWTYLQSCNMCSSFPLLIRVRGTTPTSVLAGIRAAVRAIDPTAAIANVNPMSEVILRSLGRPRFYFSLLGTFAAVAVALAVAGLYAVLSYAVAQRTRELGIRAALGGSSASIVGLVTRDGLKLVVLGVVLGLAASVGVTRLIVFMLYGVSPLDPLTWAGASALLVGAGLVASVIPAWRAARVDPLVAIQAE